MDYKTFAAYNVGGAVLWSVLLTGRAPCASSRPV